jgi:hypothetical protein
MQLGRGLLEHCSRFCSQETRCESFGETEEESRKETDQAAEQEEKRKEE